MNEILSDDCAGREGTWTRQPVVPTEDGWRGATWATHAASGSCIPAGWRGEAHECSLPDADRYYLGKRWQLGFHPNAQENPRRMAQDPLQATVESG